MRVVIIENMSIAVSTSNTIARFLSPFRFFLMYERMSRADAPMLTAAINTENIIYLHKLKKPRSLAVIQILCHLIGS